MKVLYAVAIALALALLVPVGIAKADSADPGVIINGRGPSPIGSYCDNCVDYDGNGPLILTMSMEDITYTGEDPLYSLDVWLVRIAGDSYQCFSNIYVSCDVNFGTQGGRNYVMLDYSGEGTCQHDMGQDGFCPGVIEPGGEFTSQITGTPEPGTTSLIVIGMLPLMVFWRKRWASRSAS
jgi:hypothetical protein